MTLPHKIPRYLCHKEVNAFKITQIIPKENGTGMLYGNKGDGDVYDVLVAELYMLKHQPQIGGYYVRYADGYESFSPAKAFEDGYSLAPESMDA